VLHPFREAIRFLHSMPPSRRKAHRGEEAVMIDSIDKMFEDLEKIIDGCKDLKDWLVICILVVGCIFLHGLLFTFFLYLLLWPEKH
jgi:hypothetical protein